MQRLVAELLCDGGLLQLEKRILINIPYVPPVQYIEIAWVNAAIGLNYIVLGTTTAHSAVFRLPAVKNPEIVVKIPDTDRPSVQKGLLI